MYFNPVIPSYIKHHSNVFDSEKYVFLRTPGEIGRGKTLSSQEIKGKTMLERLSNLFNCRTKTK